MTETLTITRPDDWHLHVRDGAAMAAIVPHSAAQFGRAIIMPNLKPPVTTAAQAVDYRKRILAAVPQGVQFEPLMTLYLTDNLPADEIQRAKDAGVVALKLYPAGATTNSDAGVTDLRKTYKTLEAMQREGLLLLVHGEVTSSDIDLFDREAVFIDTQLIPLRKDFPELKIVFEHITTKEAAHYVRDADRFTLRFTHLDCVLERKGSPCLLRCRRGVCGCGWYTGTRVSLRWQCCGARDEPEGGEPEEAVRRLPEMRAHDCIHDELYDVRDVLCLLPGPDAEVADPGVLKPMALSKSAE